MSEELKKIKKLYGEAMMHLCRTLFPTILEEEGKVLNALQEILAPSHLIGKDIIENNYINEFRSLIYSKCNITDTPNVEEKNTHTIKSPEELMKEHGYTLYKCLSEEDIQSFRKYYANGEELCTFLGRRLNRCHVFFAVKDNVEEIKREDFKDPKREDEYSTSVMSIQFEKGIWNEVSIKSRYNHRVINPDATYGNDLDRIAPGLSKSFQTYYKYRFQKPSGNGDFLLNMKYVKTKNGIYYRFNHEKHGIYYCENNIIINGGRVIDRYKDKERYIFMDEYILDRKDKRIIGNIDGFYKTTMLDNIIKTEYYKEENHNVIVLYFNNDKNVEICTNKTGEIIQYNNPYARKVYTNFLPYNNTLLKIDIPKVRRIEKGFMSTNNSLVSLNAPLVRDIFDSFLSYNNVLIDLNIPSVRRIGERFLIRNPYYTKQECLDQKREDKQLKIKRIVPKSKLVYI